MRRRRRRAAMLAYFFLAVICLYNLLPFVWMGLTSLKTDKEA